MLSVRRQLGTACLVLLIAVVSLPGGTWDGLREWARPVDVCCMSVTPVPDGALSPLADGQDCEGCVRPCCSLTVVWPGLPLAVPVPRPAAARPGWPADEPLPPDVDPRGIFHPPCC